MMIFNAIGRLTRGWPGKLTEFPPTSGLPKVKQRQNSGQMRSQVKSEPSDLAANFLTTERQSAEQFLIERCKLGDQVAFASLVEMHQDYVYNLAYRILQNHEEADDATQEAFVKIWQALPTFRGDSKFNTWLYRVVHNLCLNRIRSAKSGPQTVSVEFNWNDPAGGESAEERDLLANLPGDPIDDPANHFASLEQRKLIWREVDALPAKYRSIIALYYGQEFSYEEIATVLEVPVGTVKTHLYRAKALLRNKLNDLNNQGLLERTDL
ncbi:MAG: sigma-70 family RNA polymerase sigma factor [Chloroflexota bacterium]|nr:sigma-70 family RNA polymerase sigma factor [Chloroflexota bacterium]